MSIVRITKKFNSVLSKHQKVRIIELFMIMVFGGLMEMLSVSLMIPFINAVMQPEKFMNNKIVSKICELISIKSANQLLICSALLLAGIYIIKNVFLLVQTNLQLRFVYNNMFYTQIRMFKSYLDRPYEFYLNINSGEVLRVIINDTREAFVLLTSVLTLFSESVVSIILVVTIFVISPVMTVGMAVLLLVLVFVILKILRPVLRKSGLINQRSFSNMNQWVLQAIQGIKELKIMRKETFFENKFNESGNEFVKSTYQSQTYSLIPRYMIEAMTMGVFFIMVAIMIYSGIDINSIIPMLSAVAMAAIRLLPAANRISQCAADISYREPMLDKMIDNLKDIGNYAHDKEFNTTGRIKPFSNSIKLTDIVYRYPNGEKNILAHASLNIKKGECIGVVGVSGAGKTTAIDVLLGLLHPQSGHVLIDGVNICEDKVSWLKQISYIPQNIFMLDGNIRQNIAFGIPDEEIDDELVWNALKESSLDTFVTDLPKGLYTEIGERGVRVSGGQRQRIGIARALYTNPSILFFDEATSALDTGTESAIMESINKLQGMKTMIIIAHRLTTIENCDRVYEVKDGKFFEVKKSISGVKE